MHSFAMTSWKNDLNKGHKVTGFGHVLNSENLYLLSLFLEFLVRFKLLNAFLLFKHIFYIRKRNNISIVDKKIVIFSFNKFLPIKFLDLYLFINAYPKLAKFDKTYVSLIYKLYLPYKIFSNIDMKCDSCVMKIRTVCCCMSRLHS